MMKEYRTIHEISGPLMVVEKVDGVTYDELAEIELSDGSIRRCKVLEVNGDKAVVQLFESSAGINLRDSKIRFLGHPLELAVSGDMLGRVFNGMGRPIDGGPDILPEEYREAVAAALTTAHYLSGLAEYDLDAPAMEPGEDFVEHFLDTRRGYCVHFATTGVLLLRMQSIPARYASGYLAHLDESGRAAVLDSNAHAWAEIYLDGYGWYPVEMTPSGGTGSAAGRSGGGPAAPDRPETPAAAPADPAAGDPFAGPEPHGDSRRGCRAAPGVRRNALGAPGSHLAVADPGGPGLSGGPGGTLRPGPGPPGPRPHR